MASLIRPIIITLAVLIAGAVALKDIIIEDVDMGMLTRNALEAPGDLWCDAGEAEYRVPDKDIFDLVFSTPAEAIGAWVEKLQFGPNAVAPCLGQRYPAFGPDTFPLSTNLAVDYHQCGFVSYHNQSDNTITHSNVATVVLRLRSPFPHIIRRQTFRVPLHCVGSAIGGVQTNTQYFQHIVTTGDIFEQFGVSVSVKIRKVTGTTSTGLVTTSNVLTVKLDRPHNLDYDLIGHRCWATATPDPEMVDGQVGLEIIAPRGCNRYDFLTTITPIGNTEGYQYEIADFAVDDSGELYFHCDVNVCYKNAESALHCRQSSPCEVDIKTSAVNDAPNKLTATSPVIYTDQRVSGNKRK